MHVIIVGIGSIGTDLADFLSREGNHRIVLVEKDPELGKSLASRFDALVLEGDGTEPDVLRKADIEEADVLVAITESDALNTVIAMLGKQFGVPKVIVKLVEPGLRRACREIGVDAIVSPNLSTANEILTFIRGRGNLDLSYAASKGLRLGEFTLDPGQADESAHLEFPKGSLVAAILREDQAIVPSGSPSYKKGDTLLVIAQDAKTMDRVIDMMERAKQEPETT